MNCTESLLVKSLCDNLGDEPTKYFANYFKALSSYNHRIANVFLKFLKTERKLK